MRVRSLSWATRKIREVCGGDVEAVVVDENEIDEGFETRKRINYEFRRGNGKVIATGTLTRTQDDKGYDSTVVEYLFS